MGLDSIFKNLSNPNRP